MVPQIIDGLIDLKDSREIHAHLRPVLAFSEFPGAICFSVLRGSYYFSFERFLHFISIAKGGVHPFVAS